jgi:hypothetical protein
MSTADDYDSSSNNNNKKQNTNSLSFSVQTKYTDWSTAAGEQILVHILIIILLLLLKIKPIPLTGRGDLYVYILWSANIIYI